MVYDKKNFPSKINNHPLLYHSVFCFSYTEPHRRLPCWSFILSDIRLNIIGEYGEVVLIIFSLFCKCFDVMLNDIGEYGEGQVTKGSLLLLTVTDCTGCHKVVLYFGVFYFMC